MIILARIILILLALDLIGLALANDASDEARVDNGTLATLTTIQGYVFKADQSIEGTGLAHTYSNLATVNPNDASQVLSLRALGSGSGFYSHNSSFSVQNNIVTNNEFFGPEEKFESSNMKITANEDTSAVYSEINFQIPGSFRAKRVKSLWKDQTCAKNYAGAISMDSLFDYVKALNKQSTTTLYSDTYNYKQYLESESSSIGSSMEVNSQFDGAAHLGATINDVRGGISGIAKAKANRTVLTDDDYRGSFYISKKMAIAITDTTNYGDYEASLDGYAYGDYPWLPCGCNAGWDDMVIHDTRYHSAKDFFDCTTCWPPAPCKN